VLNKASSKGYGGWLRDSRVLLASQVTSKKGSCTPLSRVQTLGVHMILRCYRQDRLDSLVVGTWKA